MYHPELLPGVPSVFSDHGISGISQYPLQSNISFMDNRHFTAQRDKLISVIPLISNLLHHFKGVNKQWASAITSGMIEVGRMKPEAIQLFSPLIKDMRTTKKKYEDIQQQFAEVLLHEMVKKAVTEITDAAKFTINILKRNLFERTADVGYLATDVEIINYLKLFSTEISPEELAAAREKLQERLRDYQYEYTVYNDILVVDLAGNIRAALDVNNPARTSNDPLLMAAQAISLQTRPDEDKYIETFRPSDLRPGQGNVLIYSQKIEDPATRTPLGTLCLCFDFEDEMTRIFNDLAMGNKEIIAGILDESGTVISSSQPGVLPQGERVTVDTDADFSFQTFQNETYLVRTVETDGYQGFYGLTWYGIAMIHSGRAFTKAEDTGQSASDSAQLQNLSQELTAVKKASDELLDDMKIDGINGKIQAQVFDERAFVEVLKFINAIASEIDELCSTVIENLQKTVVESYFREAQFWTFQGNNIVDRNLYERANDVCWWALSPLFRDLLARNTECALTEKERKQLTESLQYINDLYTPYLRIVLADPDGKILAVSNPPAELEERLTEPGLPQGQELVGMQLDMELVKDAIRLPDKKSYCVSPFEPSVLYGGRPTYIYSTTVRDPENEHRPVGVIQIVFDSEPQFRNMLEDILPKDADGNPAEGCFALFLNREKTVIASTSPEYPEGSKFEFEEHHLALQNGERKAFVLERDGQTAIVGMHLSHGYREYKCTDNYTNDVFCLVFIPVE